jgi:putative hydrolase of the HAD superfamily
VIKAVVFDFDNTLMDFMRIKRSAVDSAVDAMIDAGLRLPKDKMMDKIYNHYWREGIEDQNVFDKVLREEFGQIDYKILAAGIIGYRRAKEGSTYLYPHVRMTLTELIRRGVQMIIVSDAPRLQVWMRVMRVGLEHFFDHVISFEDTGERKPSPKPFLKALSFLKTEAAETLMVGDWAERDMVGAKNVGMITCFARYGDSFNTQTPEADYEINDISEVLDIVDRNNQGKQMGLFDKK